MVGVVGQLDQFDALRVAHFYIRLGIAKPNSRTGEYFVPHKAYLEATAIRRAMQALTAHSAPSANDALSANDAPSAKAEARDG